MIVIFLGLAAFVQTFAAEPIRVMPLGDSITYGYLSTDNSGYRRKLFKSLIDTFGPGSYDFVGSLSNGASDFDTDHEGHLAWEADQLRAQLNGWLNTYSPDIILLHAGTNDINEGDSVQEVTGEISQMLDMVDAYEQSRGKPVKVILAQINNWKDTSNPKVPVITEYNLSLQAMADQRIANGDLLSVVDMEHALIYPRRSLC